MLSSNEPAPKMNDAATSADKLARVRELLSREDLAPRDAVAVIAAIVASHPSLDGIYQKSWG